MIVVMKTSELGWAAAEMAWNARASHSARRIASCNRGEWVGDGQGSYLRHGLFQKP